MEKDTETPEKFIQDAQNWKLGLFYFNSKDKRTIVPSRKTGLGPTLNFASIYSYFLLIATIVLVLIIAILPKLISGE